MSGEAKYQLVRDELEKSAGPETVEAFDVWRYFEQAARAGMQVEWFETFIADIKAGTSPAAAAWGACREWDC